MGMNIVYRDAKEGRNVKSGETMEIPESLMLSVKAGKGIKDALRETDAKTFMKVKKDYLGKKSISA